MTLCRNVQDVAYHLSLQCCQSDGRFYVTQTPGSKGELTYCAAARIGMCALRKRRTWSIVRCLSSSGSFHG